MSENYEIAVDDSRGGNAEQGAKEPKRSTLRVTVTEAETRRRQKKICRHLGYKPQGANGEQQMDHGRFKNVRKTKSPLILLSHRLSIAVAVLNIENTIIAVQKKNNSNMKRIDADTCGTSFQAQLSIMHALHSMLIMNERLGPRRQFAMVWCFSRIVPGGGWGTRCDHCNKEGDDKDMLSAASALG